MNDAFHMGQLVVQDLKSGERPSLSIQIARLSLPFDKFRKSLEEVLIVVWENALIENKILLRN